MEISVISWLHWGNYILECLKYKWQTYTFGNKKLKSTGQKNHAVDKCTNQLNTFSDVLYHWWYYFLILSMFFCPIFSYYVNGQSATRGDFLSPEVLDSFATAIYEVLEVPCSFQSFPCSVSRGLTESKIKHYFLLAIDRDTQSLSSADIVY